MRGASETIYSEDWPAPRLFPERKRVSLICKRCQRESSGWCISFACPCDSSRLISAPFSGVLKQTLSESQGIGAIVATWRMTDCPLCHYLLYFFFSPLSFGSHRHFPFFASAPSAVILISASAPDSFTPPSLSLFPFFLSLSLWTQLPFGEGLFHFYPQDTSKRRSKRSARSRQRLQKDNRVSGHAGTHDGEGQRCISCMHMWAPGKWVHPCSLYMSSIIGIVNLEFM